MKVVANEIEDSNTVSVTVSWVKQASNGADILGYKLYSKVASTSEPFTLVYDGSKRADLLTYTFNNIEAGKNLEVKVSAINIVGESSLSNSLLLIPAAPPSSPRNPIITGLSLGQISIEWEAALRENGASINGYYVEYKTLSDATYSRSSLIDGLSTSLTTLIAD